VNRPIHLMKNLSMAVWTQRVASYIPFPINIFYQVFFGLEDSTDITRKLDGLNASSEVEDGNAEAAIYTQPKVRASKSTSARPPGATWTKGCQQRL